MRESGPLSVSLIICESVLNESTGAASAIRIMDVLTIGKLSRAIRFFVITYLHSYPGDFEEHVAKVRLLAQRNGEWVSAADAPPHAFKYSYRMDPGGPGAFMLSTEFNLEVAKIGELGTFWIQLSVDQKDIERTPLTLLWKAS
jgi:hypothetical protein